MLVWTLMRDGPFRLGGDKQWRPHGIEVEKYTGPFDLGAGFTGFVVTAPSGATFVAEAESGAFVGPSVADVRKDINAAIANGHATMMREQVDAAKAQRSKSMTMLEPEQFWSRLHCNKPTTEETH